MDSFSMQKQMPVLDTRASADDIGTPSALRALLGIITGTTGARAKHANSPDTIRDVGRNSSTVRHPITPPSRFHTGKAVDSGHTAEGEEESLNVILIIRVGTQ